MSRTIEGFKLPKPLIPWMEYFEKYELEKDEDWRHYEGMPKNMLIKDANSKRKTLSLKSFLGSHIKAFKDNFRYIEKEYFLELLEDLKDIYKRKGSTDVDIEDPKEYLKYLESYGKKHEDSSSDDETKKKKGEGIKRGPGRPKKIVMKSYSSSSDEESEKMGMGLKVKRGRPITVKGHKKCSCGSGLDVEPYQKFFQALKANTTLK